MFKSLSVGLMFNFSNSSRFCARMAMCLEVDHSFFRQIFRLVELESGCNGWFEVPVFGIWYSGVSSIFDNFSGRDCEPVCFLMASINTWVVCLVKLSKGVRSMLCVKFGAFSEMFFTLFEH